MGSASAGLDWTVARALRLYPVQGSKASLSLHPGCVARSSCPPLLISALRKSLRCQVIMEPEILVLDRNATVEMVRFGSDNAIATSPLAMWR